MSAEEPPTKKQKNPADWEGHTLNINEAVMKIDEGSNLTGIAEASVSVLQGIGPKSDAVLEALKVETVSDLATYKFFTVARSIKTLAATEEKGKRPSGSVMNIDLILDKEYETKSLNEILEAPVSALEGLTTKADDLLKDLGVKTIGDLADFKYCKWAEAIVTLAKYEELQTKEEKRMEKVKKNLE
jgi:predicted RecB family nuclease